MAEQNHLDVYLNYLIIDSDPFQLRLKSLVFGLSTPPHVVFQIRALIDGSQMVSVGYSVYKVDINIEDLHYLQQAADIDCLLNEALPDYAPVSQHWPQGFLPEVIHIVLKKPSERISTTPSVVGQDTNLANNEVEDNEAVQSEILKALAKYSTSTQSSISHYKKHQEQRRRRILNGRPASATGLPIGLYHPIFDTFQSRTDSMPVTPKQLSDTLRLIIASQNMYNKESGVEGRTEILLPILDSLLGFYVKSAGAKGSKSDGVIQATNGGYCMIMEMRNEIGTGGSDPSIQGAVAFAKYWAQDRLKWIRQQCCCPTFILAIAGPWICVLGGVMVRHPVIQPLTPFFPVANNPPSWSTPDNIARTFASLALSISDLLKFYQSISPLGKRPERLRFYPYVRHFTHNGKRVDIEYESQIQTKAVFRAIAVRDEDDRYPIVVKFAESYNAAAHRLLATKGLAPELLYISSEDPEEAGVAKRTMVVMRLVSGWDLATAGHSPSIRVLDDISDALKILHDNNLVYGDLRSPNILVVMNEQSKRTRGMLIDFDWCGPIGQAKYPYNINPAIRWPKGVGAGVAISVAHDLAMLEELRRDAYD